MMALFLRNVIPIIAWITLVSSSDSTVKREKGLRSETTTTTPDHRPFDALLNIILSSKKETIDDATSTPPPTPYTASAQEDTIQSLPGLSSPPSFRQFSGYLSISPNKNNNLFYWFVESQSSPSTDPVVFWTNGGPGCSGLIGFGTEHGPFLISSDLILTPNPYSWNTVANMVYIEQPLGVGFSYSDDEEEYVTGDEKAANDNYNLIQEFYKRFDYLKGNDMYISSESYGGHYIPQLTSLLLSKKEDMEKEGILFRGFALGNPYVDPWTNSVSTYQTWYYNGLIAGPLYKQWQESCTTEEQYQSTSWKCNILAKQMYDGVGQGINPYALDYPVCLNKGQDSDETSLSSMVLSAQARQLRKHQRGQAMSESTKYQPCADQNLAKYLNQKDVQTALHVRGDITWTMCSNTIQYSRDDANTPVIDLYRTLIKEGPKNNLNMLIYSGDDDSVCSLAGTQDWIFDLGVDPQQGKRWKVWRVDGQTAGYVTHFNVEGPGKFVLATVRDAGHQVPTYKPKEALELFKGFLSGKL